MFYYLHIKTLCLFILALVVSAVGGAPAALGASCSYTCQTGNSSLTQKTVSNCDRDCALDVLCPSSTVFFSECIDSVTSLKYYQVKYPLVSSRSDDTSACPSSIEARVDTSGIMHVPSLCTTGCFPCGIPYTISSSTYDSSGNNFFTAEAHSSVFGVVPKCCSLSGQISLSTGRVTYDFEAVHDVAVLLYISSLSAVCAYGTSSYHAIPA